MNAPKSIEKPHPSGWNVGDRVFLNDAYCARWGFKRPVRVLSVSGQPSRPRGRRPVWWITVGDLAGTSVCLAAGDLRRRKPK